ncbi:MAG: hypothetical protein WC412_06995 [Candidatus Omnitrophota bacterium]|jgi:hypothetical protein
MNIVKDVVSDLKGEIKPAKLITTFIIVLGVLWIIVLLGKKFGWFNAVNPLKA